MTQLNERRLAEEIQRLVDRRVEAFARNRLTDGRWGVVDSDPDTLLRTVSVRFYGQPQASPGVVYGGVPPRVGDLVWVVVKPDGDRFILGIFGRDVVSELIDVSLPNPDAPPVDRAANARIQVAGEQAAPVVIQSIPLQGADLKPGALPGGYATATEGWASTTGGTTLLLVTAKRNVGVPDLPPEWTELGTLISPNLGIGDGASVAIRPAVAGESAVRLNTATNGGTVLALAEISGNLALDDTAPNSAEPASGVTDTVFAPVTPTAGVPAIVFGVLMDWAAELNSPLYTPDAGWTEIADTFDGAGGGHPQIEVIYKAVAETSGSYEPGSTFTGAATSRAYATLTVALVASPNDDSFVPAPETIDEDDATYHLAELAEALRLDLLAPYRIIRSRLVIACSSAGAKSYDLRGANDPDFGDEVTLATAAFTSAGGFATNTVSLLWATSTSYRYWRLVGPTEARRIHTLELYETTPGQVVVTDPTTDEFAEIDAALAAIFASIAAHLGDTTDAHDASATSVADAGTFFVGADVEAVLQEIGAILGGLSNSRTFTFFGG